LFCLKCYAFLFVVIQEMEQEHEQAQTSSTKTQAQIRIEKSQVVQKHRSINADTTQYKSTCLFYLAVVLNY